MHLVSLGIGLSFVWLLGPSATPAGNEGKLAEKKPAAESKADDKEKATEATEKKGESIPAPNPARVEPKVQVAPAAILRGRMVVNQNGQAPPPAPSTLLSDPGISRRINEAKQLLEEGERDRGLFLVQAIFDNEETSFLRVSESESISAHQGALDLIRTSPELMERYRFLHEDEASHLLSLGDKTRDPVQWGKVVRRFPLTSAYYQAVERLATHHLDAGRAALAMYYFDVLTSAPSGGKLGPVTNVKRMLTASIYTGRPIEEAELPDRTIQVALGGEKRSARDFLEAFMSERPADRPDSSGKRLSFAKFPMTVADWSVEMSSESKYQNLVEGRVEDYIARRAPLIFGYSPVRIDDRIYFRNMDDLWCIDADTGKKIAHAKASITRISQEMKNSQNQFQQAMIQTGGVDYTFVTNQVYGSITTDGDLVYAISNLPVNPLPFVPQVMGRQPNAEYLHRSRNTILALDPTTLEKVWEIGDGKADAPTFYFGPPQPLEGKLYVVGESKGEISLYCLEPVDGSVAWKQILSISARGVESDLYRRSQACHLTIAGGILLCPTNLFRLSAYDPFARLRLWDFSLLDGDRIPPQYLMAMQAVHPPANANPTDPPFVVRNRVVVWEPLGSTLRCLDLTTGKGIWKADRAGDWFIGSATSDLVILIGPASVRALSLTDGTEKWRSSTPMPSGRGSLVHDDLLLPCVEGRLLSIDVLTGKITHQVQDRHRQSAGSIVSHGDSILTVSAEGLRSFAPVGRVQAEVERLLLADPDSASGRYRRAQLLLMEGKPQESVSDLRVAAKSSADEVYPKAARELMFDIASREAVEKPADFSTLADDLKPLVSSDEERGIYVRLQAENALRDKNIDRLLALVDEHSGLDLKGPVPSDRLAESKSPATWGRWIIARSLRYLGEKGSERILSVLATRIETAHTAKDTDALRKWSFVLPEQPLGAKARFHLVDLVLAKNELGEADYLLQETLSVKDSSVKRESLQRLIGLARKVGNADLAGDYQNMLDRLDSKKPISLGSDATGSREDWSSRKISVASEKTYRPDSTKRTLFPSTNDSNFFRDWIVSFDQQRWELTFLSEKTGTVEWKLTNLPRTMTYIQPLEYKQIGSLLTFSQCSTIYAVSGYDRKLLWHQAFENSPQDTNVAMSTGGRVRVVNAQGMIYYSQGMNSPWPMIGPAGSGYLTVRSGKHLHVMHPWTHEIMWTRSDIRPDHLLAGDDEYLVLFGSDGSIDVHRTLDGDRVPCEAAPDLLRQRKKIVGRRVLLLENEGVPNKPRILKLYDPVLRVDYWKRPLPDGTEWKAEAEEFALLLAPTRKLIVVRLSDGEILLEDTLTADQAGTTGERVLTGVTLFSDGQRIFIMGTQPMKAGEQSWPVSASPNIRIAPTHGWIRAYDASTRQLLWHQPLQHRTIITQPGRELPVLLAVGARMIDLGNNNKQLATTFEVFDKATGKSLHTEEHSQYGQMLDVAYSVQDRWVELRGFNVKVRLTFEDETRPPPSEKSAPAPNGQPAGEEASKPRNVLDEFRDRLQKARESKKSVPTNK